MRNDSRPIKTKKSIKQALLILLNERDISNITISELAETANVSRKTFYLHYKDIGEILDDIKADLAELFDQSLMKSRVVGFRVRMLNFTSNIVQKVKSDEHYYTLIASSSYAKIIFDSLEVKLQQELLYALDTETKLPMQKKVSLVDFMIGGIINTVLKWAKDESDISTEEMSNILFEFINNNVATYLKADVSGY